MEFSPGKYRIVAVPDYNFCGQILEIKNYLLLGTNNTLPGCNKQKIQCVIKICFFTTNDNSNANIF
jgi:hypothetical protein